jgi:hypothetical protein
LITLITLIFIKLFHYFLGELLSVFFVINVDLIDSCLKHCPLFEVVVQTGDDVILTRVRWSKDFEMMLALQKTLNYRREDLVALLA